MTIKAWVKHVGGAAAAAKLLGVKVPRVRSWLRKDATPNYDVMVRIVSLSKGKVTIEGIVRETNEGRRK